jgi:hypothetical protein
MIDKIAQDKLRYRVLHTTARLVRGGRRRYLKIQATWPWADAITAAWQRIDAIPQAPRAADGSGELRLPSYDLFSSTEVLTRLAIRLAAIVPA